jgi:hypothetical protein
MTALPLPLWPFHRDSGDNFATKMVSKKYEVKHLFINWAVILVL